MKQNHLNYNKKNRTAFFLSKKSLRLFSLLPYEGATANTKKEQWAKFIVRKRKNLNQKVIKRYKYKYFFKLKVKTKEIYYFERIPQTSPTRSSFYLFHSSSNHQWRSYYHERAVGHVYCTKKKQ